MGVLRAFAHHGLITVPTESRNPPSLTLRTARYDHHLDTFVPVGENGGLVTLPLAEDEHVAALGRAGCRQTGLARTFLVLATRGRLTIGRLSVEHLTYEATGMVASPRGEGDGGAEECLECWLADGPTVVARYPSNVVTASARQERGVPWREFERRGCREWKADMLQGSFRRVFVAENQVLCVSGASTSGSSSEFVRSADLLSFSLASDNRVGLCNGALARAELPLELDPCSITCVAYVRSALELPYKVVLGTSDGRLKCCSHSKVIMEVTLEDALLSVTVAESAHGVPVLVVSSGGMDRKVVTFFADSLHQIHSWTGVQQVVVDDLAGVGCDQMLLITQPSSAVSFEQYRRVSLLECGSQNANDKHGSKILRFIDDALEMRLQDGVKELRVAEQRRLDKMQMLTSACNLMHSIAVQQARGSKTGDGTDVPEDAVFMECVELQEVYAGRCFVIMNVRVKKAAEGIHLLGASLFATSLHGFVKSMTSCLPSQGGSQRFLFSFPLKDCNLELHVMLAAEVSTPGGDLLGVEGPSNSSRAGRMYTQWIHSVEDFNVSKAVGSAVRGCVGDATAVCEKWMSVMGGAMSQEHFRALVRAVLLQSSRGSYGRGESESAFEAEAEGGRHDAEEALHTKMPLTSMYVRDVSVVSENTGSTSFWDSVSNLYGPRLVEMVIHLADVMLDEIRSCANGTSDVGLAELQAATDRCLCHLLSSIMCNKASRFC